MNKCVEPLQKQTMGVAFFSQNSQLLTFSLPKKGIFSCTRPKSACGKSSSSRFSFSATRNTITQVKDLTFGISFRILFYFPFLGNIEWHRLLELRIFLFFFLAAIIRENLDMRPWIENGHRFAIHLLTWHSWLVVSNTCKKIIVILYACLTRISRLFSGQGIVLNHRSLYNSFSP